jgi:hypothetical protein
VEPIPAPWKEPHKADAVSHPSAAAPPPAGEKASPDATHAGVPALPGAGGGSDDGGPKATAPADTAPPKDTPPADPTPPTEPTRPGGDAPPDGNNPPVDPTPPVEPPPTNPDVPCKPLFDGRVCCSVNAGGGVVCG